MSTFTRVVPGKVVNHGIVSGETFPTINVIQTSPAHFPDFAAVTPKGGLDRANVTLAAFERRFGDVSDHYGMYYNPVTYGILKLREAQQHSMSFKRLTNNYSKARTVWGVALFEDQDVPDFERNDDGSYKTDGSDALIPKETKIKGLFALTGYLEIEPKYFGDVEGSNQTKRNLAPIEVTVTTANDYLAKDVKGTFYPFASLVSGVGDYYNNMYASFGHSTNVDWDTVERFVKVNGVYPFQMTIGERKDSGLNVDASTESGATIGNFTLYDTLDADTNVAYSLRKGLGDYTGANNNRPVELLETPYSSVEVYQQNIDTVCKKLYEAEYTVGGEEAPELSTTRAPVQAIMNPIDLKNETGVPYRFIVSAKGAVAESNVQNAKFVAKEFGLTNRLPASGGLNPFLTLEGVYPDAPTDWDEDKQGEWVVTPSATAQPSKLQLWTMTQDLMEVYYGKYLTSKYWTDVIRNRTSFLWDLGYRQSITEMFLQATEKRKDFLAIACATIYGGKNEPESIYNRARTIHAKAVQHLESEEYNAPATRMSINLWDSYYIDEPTFDKFSLNIDLMVAFAAAGGSQDGRVSKANLPDAGTNAILRIAHTPTVDYEDDVPAAENLTNGCITLRPCNLTQWKRPALPTVYNNIDSVLKDLPNVWFGVIIEKILQDQWIMVSGQTMPAQSYLSTVRDNADAQIHNLIGSCLSSWEVQTEFRENEPNSRSRMFSKVIYWVGKARYMMDAVLEARNEEELAQTTTTNA